MINIDSFIFGNIIINGRKFSNDVIVFWDGEIQDRKKAHAFTKDEVQNVLMKEPEVVIIGTGTGGLAKADPAIEVAARLEGVELLTMKTPEAVLEFNKLSRRRKVAALLHLTC